MSATNSAQTVSGVRAKPTLEIISEDRFLVFHGDQFEARPALLKGCVRLSIPEDMEIQKPTVTLEGKRKFGWIPYLVSPMGPPREPVVEKTTFFSEERKLGVQTMHKLAAGIIEWPFEFELAPSMPESVEGIHANYIIYRLRARVGRRGWTTRDLMVDQHIRIVRTLGPDYTETTRARLHSDIWANKVSYKISIPTDAYVFGTCIPIDMELSPLRKGLEMKSVEAQLIEYIVQTIRAGESSDPRRDRSSEREYTIVNQVQDFPEQSKVLYEDETADNPVMADEMYKFPITVDLPQSLHKCRQDVDQDRIRITHYIRLLVNIRNPEGHTSQLVSKFPVKLFISPNLPVDESNRVTRPANGISDEDLNRSLASPAAIPPQYGLHHLDQMYSDIDPARFLSRAGSASATPAGGLALSRRHSQEALGPVNGLMEGGPSWSHGSATPHILQSRLARLQLQEAGGAGHAGQLGWEASAGGPPNESAPSQSERGLSPPAGRSTTISYFDAASHDAADGPNTHAAHSPPAHYDLDDLNRVPSYGTALRSSTQATPLGEQPPGYRMSAAHSSRRSAAAASSATSHASGDTPSAASAAASRGEGHASSPTATLPTSSDIQPDYQGSVSRVRV